MTSSIQRINQFREALDGLLGFQTTPKITLYQRMQKVRKENPYFGYADIERIINLPVGRNLSEEEVVEISREFLTAEAFAEGRRLFHLQAKGLVEFLQYNRLFAPIPVGFGKTFLSLAIPAILFRNGVRKIMLHVPSNVMHQLVMHDLRWMRNFSPIPYPIHVLGGQKMQQRRMIANSGRSGLYIIPYSLLSTRDSSEILEAIQPEAIICDECHNLSNRNAARTRRLMAYVEKHRPIGVCLSGTITTKSIHEYYHLIRWCLGEYNPLPNSSSLAHEWASIIDADSDCEEPSQAAAGPLMPLVDWAKRWFPEQSFPESLAGFREAYKARLTSAPGVAASGSHELGTSIIIHNAPVKNFKKEPGWDKLEELIRQVNEEWLTPGGDELEHEMMKWKWLNELCSGFYNELYWPEACVLAARRGISESQAADILERAKKHHQAEQEYHRELRRWLSECWKPGIDTPMTVALNMAQHGDRDVSHDLYAAWRRKEAHDFMARPERDSRAIRVCPFKINDAVRWAQSISPKGALIWVLNIGVGEWLYEELVKAGLPALHAPAGTAGNEAILDKANADRIIVASIKAHGEGKNLQHFQEQYFLQWPRSAKRAEQTIGRTHRNGQKADELVIRTNHTLEFDHANFAATLNDACYIQQTTGHRQKLFIAAYCPMPKILPSIVLHERGLQPMRLTSQQQKILNERFASSESSV